MHRSGKRTLALVAIVAVVIGLVALNTLFTFGWRSARLDLTQEKLYSLSPGVKELVRHLDEKVRVDLYWSDSVGNDFPQFRMLAQQTREFLEELASASGGKLEVKQIDPKPFSEEEDAARAAGLAVRPVDSAGRTLTLGIVVRGPTDRAEVIPTLSPEEEPFLEYELARRIVSVERGAKPLVAVLSTIPETRGGDPRDPSSATPSMMVQQLRSLFDVRYIEMPPDSPPAIPPETKLLVLIQPRAFSSATLRAIDAWVTAGKPLLAFLDPWCETDPAARQQGFNGGGAGTTYDLGPLPASWGIEMAKDETGGAAQLVVGDRTYATRVRAPTSGGRSIELDYLPYLSLRDAAIAKKDPVTGTVKQVNIMTVGSIRKTKDATTTIEPLLSSSSDCELITTLKLGFFGQPDQLIKDFKSIGAAQWLAVRVHGPVKSAYPAAEGGAAPATSANANIIVIADADLLEDRAWVQENRFGNQLLGYTAFANNNELVMNAVETLTGDRVLSELRGRGQYRRPFDRVEQLKKTAEANYLAEETALQTKIKDSEQRINQLQREKAGSGQNSLVLSPEQEVELTKLNATMADARKQLRSVQHKLAEDVERLGRSLMLLNVVVWPIFVALIASFWSVGRAQRQRSTRAAAKGGAR